MTWQIITGANILIGIAYFSIAGIVFNGLRKTGQLGANKLGTATAVIFLTCAVHHTTHSVHMLLPSLGIQDAQALALRESWHWPTAMWDLASVGAAFFYLSLRGAYSSVLRGAQMFEDLKVRERQALEINDNIVQGLTVAKYAMDAGADDKSRRAVEDTLRASREIISELLGDRGSERELHPGDLRRTLPAELAASPRA
jgi:hypothetical protein